MDMGILPVSMPSPVTSCTAPSGVIRPCQMSNQKTGRDYHDMSRAAHDHLFLPQGERRIPLAARPYYGHPLEPSSFYMASKGSGITSMMQSHFKHPSNLGRRQRRRRVSLDLLQSCHFLSASMRPNMKTNRTPRFTNLKQTTTPSAFAIARCLAEDLNISCWSAPPYRLFDSAFMNCWPQVHA